MVVLSLGTNLGDRSANMAEMVNRVCDILTPPFTFSPLYETEPVGVDHEQNYLNQIIAGDFDGTAHDLLVLTQRIEKEMGRTAKGELRPRTADIDILLFNEIEMNTTQLTIPHHALFERKFEIVGVQAVIPEQKIPGSDSLFGDYKIAADVQRQKMKIIERDY